LPVPLEGSATGAAVAAAALVIIENPPTDRRTEATASEQAIGVVGQTLAVPLRSEQGVIGVLVASRAPGEEGFDGLDREMTRAIAAHAGLALQLAEVRRAGEQLRLAEDRAEIAEDLRHRVIERLFAHGLALQGLASRFVKMEGREALERQVEEVDAIIREVRDSVFSLGGPIGESTAQDEAE
jgi:GAF domain-containing protein